MAAEGEFKSDKECVTGKKVTTRQNKTGKVVSVERGFCRVQFADGKTEPHLFWMLRPAGTEPKPHLKQGAITPGLYACNMMGIELHIVSGEIYKDGKGTPGRYRMAKDGTIVFENGSFSPDPYAQGVLGAWLQERKIGLSVGVRGMYNIICDRR